jgi:hypothetical protein
MILNDAQAARMAGIALGHVTREYPHKLDNVLSGDADARTPRDLHPVFFGSFDWHSCEHGWWLLMRDTTHWCTTCRLWLLRYSLSSVGYRHWVFGSGHAIQCFR